MRQIEESHKTMQQLAKMFPGCFHADGSPIVASAHLPRLPDTKAEPKELDE